MKLLEFVLVTALSAPCAAADGAGTIARGFAKAARTNGVSRVAVLPFTPAVAAPAGDGYDIAARITHRLVREAGVQVVERPLLRRVMEEQHLVRNGAFEARGIKDVGQLMAVDAVVVGTFALDGEDLLVDARLIDVRSGVVLAAEERVLRRRRRGAGAPPLPLELGPALWPTRPASSAVPVIEGNEAAARSEPVDCSQAATRVDTLQLGILDFKARYWAERLAQGDSWEGLGRIPGAMITDEDLRWRLYDLIRAYFTAGAVPPLSEPDIRIFTEIDERAYRLHEACLAGSPKKWRAPGARSVFLLRLPAAS